MAVCRRGRRGGLRPGPEDHERRGGADLLGRRHHDDLGRGLRHCPLDVRLLGIAGAEAVLGVDAGHAHEIEVGPDRADGFGRGPAHRHHRMLEQPAPDQLHLGTMVYQFGRDRRTVRHDHGTQIAIDAADQLERRGSSVHEHHVARPDQLHGGLGKSCLFRREERAARGQVLDGPRSRQRATMDAQQEPFGREFTQIATHRVLRYLKRGSAFPRDDTALRFKDLEQALLALAGEHLEAAPTVA